MNMLEDKNYLHERSKKRSEPALFNHQQSRFQLNPKTSWGSTCNLSSSSAMIFAVTS